MRAAHGRLAAASAVLAAMVALGACGSDDGGSGPQKLDLKIGNVIPKTGFLEQFGQPAQNAGDLAVEEIRKAAAKARAQHKVTITHADDQSLPGPGAQAAKKMVEAGSRCLVGSWSGNVTSRVAVRVAIPEKVLQISPATTGDAFSNVDDRGFLNRVVPRDDLQAEALVQLLDQELGGARGKKVNVGRFQSTYGEDLFKRFEEAWSGKGGQIGEEVTYRPDQPSFEEQSRELGSGGPDAWVFFDFVDTYQRIANDLVAKKSENKFSPKRAFGTDSLANPRLASVAPNASAGLRGVAISAPKTGPAAQQFDALMKARSGGKRQTFDAQEFDAVMLCYLSAVAAGSTAGDAMADEVRKVSAPPGRKYTWQQLDQAVKALEQGEDIDYEGVSGPIDMNDDGDATAGVYDVYEFEDDELQLGDQIAVPQRTGGI